MATAFRPAGWTEMKNRLQIYVALEDVNFIWCERTEIPLVEKLWTDGAPIWEIAEQVGRDVDEVAILIMDRVRQGFIKPRPRGAYGRRRERAGT